MQRVSILFFGLGAYFIGAQAGSEPAALSFSSTHSAYAKYPWRKRKRSQSKEKRISHSGGQTVKGLKKECY